MDEIDIWRSATVLIRQHGDDAPIVAAMRVDELADASDEEGAMTWRWILRVVKELQSTEPGGPVQ